MIDENRFDELYDEIWEDFAIDINDVITDELLGIIPGTIILDKKTLKQLMDIYDVLDNNYLISRKKLEKIKKQIPDIPILHFFDLLILQKEDISKYNENLKECLKVYPDYPLIKLLFLIEMVTSGEVLIKNPDQTLFIQTIFPGRTKLHTIEVLHFAAANILILSQINDPTQLQAFICVLEDLELLEDYDEIIDSFIYFAKTRIVHNHLSS